MSSTTLASLCKASVRAIVSHALRFQLIREISRQLLIPLDLIHSNVMKTTLRCNYDGTVEATEHFLPLMKNKGRVVNVASMSGRLNKFSDTIRDQFLASKTVPDITKLMERFRSAVDAAREKEQGWLSAGYAISKVGVIGMTKAIATAEKGKGRKVLINSCCPGYVKTDITRGGGSKTPDQRAQAPVMPALEDLNDRSGLFLQDEMPIEW